MSFAVNASPVRTTPSSRPCRFTPVSQISLQATLPGWPSIFGCFPPNTGMYASL
jgi:hypothetical protein